MATGKALDGKPYAGNPHVRFDEGEVAPAAKPRRGSLLYSIMIDLPPAMAQEAQGYADLRGTTLEKALLDCISAELERSRNRSENASRLMEQWRELVRKGRGRLTEPYKFNRADAYPEGEYA